MKVRKRKKKMQLKINRTAMYWLNPITHNLVSYPRAQQLHLIHKKNVKHGIKNPKTGKLITASQAVNLGLVEIAD